MHGLDAARDPRPDGIVTAREVVRVVSVQALHARPRPADAAPLARFGERSRALGRVLLVRPHELGGERRIGLGALVEAGDLSRGLEPRDGSDRVRTREPEERRERMALGIEWLVADDERMTGRATGDHRERRRRRTAELLLDLFDVARASLAHGGRYLRLCSMERL